MIKMCFFDESTNSMIVNAFKHILTIRQGLNACNSSIIEWR